jgi:hypothetical protein
MRGRLGALLLSAIAGFLLAAPAARSNGDPASDVLPLEDVFFPVSAPVSPSLVAQLKAVAREARGAGYGVKVALIAAPDDLGVVPQLFGRPQEYASFLGREISFNTRPRLLVVMPAGYGLFGAEPRARRTARTLARPASAAPDDLGRAALDAVRRLSARAGHPIPLPPVSKPGGAGSSGGSPLLVFGAPAALVVLGGALAAARRLRERRT